LTAASLPRLDSNQLGAILLALCFNRAGQRNHNEVSAKAKPKQVRARTENSESLNDAKSVSRRKAVRDIGDGLKSKPTDNGKSPRQRNTAKRAKKKSKTADELMMEVWQ